MLEGDEIWVDKKEVTFIKPKDGMLSKKKLHDYASTWNAFPEAVLNVKGSVDDISSQIWGSKQEQNDSYTWVPSFKTLLFTCSGAWFIYLVYENVKLLLSKNTQTPP